MTELTQADYDEALTAMVTRGDDNNWLGCYGETIKSALQLAARSHGIYTVTSIDSAPKDMIIDGVKVEKGEGPLMFTGPQTMDVPESAAQDCTAINGPDGFSYEEVEKIDGNVTARKIITREVIKMGRYCPNCNREWPTRPLITDEMVERVARAIHNQLLGKGDDWKDVYATSQYPLVKEQFLSIARAALEAAWGQ